MRSPASGQIDRSSVCFRPPAGGGGGERTSKRPAKDSMEHSPAKTNRDSGGRRAPRSAAGREGKACTRLPEARRNAAAARDAAAGPPPASACGRCGSSTRWAEPPQGSTARAMQSGRGAARKGTEIPEPPGLPRRAPVGRVQDARRGEGRDAGRRGRVRACKRHKCDARLSADPDARRPRLQGAQPAQPAHALAARPAGGERPRDAGGPGASPPAAANCASRAAAACLEYGMAPFPCISDARSAGGLGAHAKIPKRRFRCIMAAARPGSAKSAEREF